jgi:flagellar protein FliL
MAKKKKGDDEESQKGGKKKKLVIGLLAAVALFGAKTMLMKPPTAAQAAAEKLAAEQDMKALCARQNAPVGHGEAATATTTVPEAAAAAAPAEVIDPHTERGGVLEMEPLTVNLADGHYLKIGIALQLDKVTLVETAKSEGLGAKALDMAIASLSTKTMDQLSEPAVRDALKHKLGVDACTAYEGEVLTVYFTDFVMQ